MPTPSHWARFWLAGWIGSWSCRAVPCRATEVQEQPQPGLQGLTRQLTSQVASFPRVAKKPKQMPQMLKQLFSDSSLPSDSG